MTNCTCQLCPPPPPRHRLEADAAADCRRDDPQLGHQPIELRWEHRLRAVAEGVIRIAVHLDDQAVGAGGHRGAGHRRHHVAPSGAVARVGDDRQVAELADDRDRRDVEGVARRRLEGADAALAEDDVVVAAAQHVLGRQQPLLDRRRDAALDHHRFADVAELAQQGEVLHVARADLVDVGVLVDHLDLTEIHHLGDQLHALGGGRVAEQAQPLLAEPLEAVRRAPRLERATAEALGAGAPHRRGGRAHLLLVLGRARAGHDDHLVAADADVADGDHGVVRLEGPARQLVRRRDAQHLVDTLEHLDQAGLGVSRSDGAEDGALDPRRAVYVHAHFHQSRHDLRDLIFGGPFLHHYDHGCLASTSGVSTRNYYRATPLSRPDDHRRTFVVNSITSADTVHSPSFRWFAADLAVNHPPLEAARFIDDTFEQPRDGVRAERPLHRDVPHVLEHLLLALGLIDVDALLLFQPADLAGDARALVEQADQNLVDTVDVFAQIVKGCHSYT